MYLTKIYVVSLGQIKFIRTEIGVVLNTKKFVQTDLASVLVNVLHQMHTKCNWDIILSLFCGFLMLLICVCLMTLSLTHHVHSRITNSVLERTCKVAPWLFECNYSKVTDSPRETFVTIITLLFEVRIGCVPSSTQKLYHLNPIAGSYSSYWSSRKRSCNRREGCDYLPRCTT